MYARARNVRATHRYRAHGTEAPTHWHTSTPTHWQAGTHRRRRDDAHTIAARTTLVCTRVNSLALDSNHGRARACAARFYRVGGATTYTPTSESAATDRAAAIVEAPTRPERGRERNGTLWGTSLGPAGRSVDASVAARSPPWITSGVFLNNRRFDGRSDLRRGVIERDSWLTVSLRITSSWCQRPPSVRLL